jgi:hypothetical protein
MKTDCTAYDSSRIDELIKNVPNHKEHKETSALLGSQQADAQDWFTEAAVAALMRS